jgi:hypothetical protein
LVILTLNYVNKKNNKTWVPISILLTFFNG